MMNPIEPRDHPSDEALAAWVDARIGGENELVEMARAVTPHLADCAECRARVQELESVVAMVRARPAAASTEALALRKARVMEAIGRGARIRPIRSRAWWLAPAIAAAALAVVLIMRQEGDERVPSGVVDRTAGIVERTPAESAAPVTETPLPVVSAASAAADEAAAAIAAASDAPDGAVTLDPAEAPASETLGDVTLVDEFASLSPEDQEAILDELAAMEFEL